MSQYFAMFSLIMRRFMLKTASVILICKIDNDLYHHILFLSPAFGNHQSESDKGIIGKEANRIYSQKKVKPAFQTATHPAINTYCCNK